MTRAVDSPPRRTAVTVTTLGGPTALIEIGNLRLLTDPTFDGPGEYPLGSRVLRKTSASAQSPDQVGPIDVVLLSHDQHPDNLDRSGREFLAKVRLVLTTPAGATRLGDPVRGLATWDTVVLGDVNGRPLRVTGMPARHGPAGCEPLTGDVTGFLLHGDGHPTVYVSGDNASIDMVRQVAVRARKVDVAVLFAGAARTPLLPGENLTLTSGQAAQATIELGYPETVVVHTEGWEHFTETYDDVRDAFARRDLLHMLRAPGPGCRVVL